MSSVNKASGDLLERYLRTLFPGLEFHKNARKASTLHSPLTGFPMELDFWIPDLKLAFEFQDPYHYTTGWVSTKSHSRTKQEDYIKQEAMVSKGQTLISIPYWWDGKIESLVGTIQEHRPDLLKHHPLTSSYSISAISPSLIPESPPPRPHTGEFRHISDIGGVMQISFPPLATFEPNNWWASEKYDGVRALWHPRESVFYSRFGHELRPLQNYVTLFPSIFIDSEIWFGRDTYRIAQNILHVNGSDGQEIDWERSSLRFIAFDSPSSPEMSFESRFESLLLNINTSHPCALPTGPIQCKGLEHSQRLLQSLIASSGEGVVLIKPTSSYISGYSPDALKIKKSRDYEALVVGVDAAGNYELLEHASQVQFSAQLSASMRHSGWYPSRGDVVTYVFDRYSAEGRPWDAMIVKVRTDLAWSHDSAPRITSPSVRSIPLKRLVKPHGHWSIQEGVNVKRFLDDFAAKRNFDPRIPENWYKIKVKDIVHEKDGGIIFSKYNSLHHAILYHYPDIGLDITRFNNIRGAFDAKAKRDWLDSFAHKSGFDPLDADNWYTVSPADIFKSKEGKAIIRHYGSFRVGLIDLYPEITFDTIKFSKLPQGYWQGISEKDFLDSMAKRLGFDPLKADNWYFLDKKVIHKEKGGFSILNRFNGSVIKMTRSAYPDIGLDTTKFKKCETNHWHSMENRKIFFDKFAQEKGFDPLEAENWSPYTQNDFIAAGGKTLMSMYNNSYITALLDVYPDIGLHHGIFRTKPQKYWQYTNNMRNFCDDYAAKKGLNPLSASDWYSVDRSDMMNEKGAWNIVLRFGGLDNALIQLYPELSLSRHLFYRRPRPSSTSSSPSPSSPSP